MIESTYMGFLRTLGNDTRLGIVLCLKKGPKNVSQLVNELKMEQSRVSHSLQCLERNGFVTVKKSGKERVYSLNQDTLNPILDDIKKHIRKYKLCDC